MTEKETQQHQEETEELEIIEVEAEIIEEEDLEPETSDESAEEPLEGECLDVDSVEEALVCLEEKLREAEKQAAEYLDGWQRCQASFANYRKRMEADQSKWREVANAGLLSRLIPVLDDFERAFKSVPEELKEHAWLEGITLVHRKIKSILEAENVRPLEVQPGDEFDPNYHQAVLHQQTEAFEEGQIVVEAERGYMQGERVLRPAMVVVAKAPPAPPPDKVEPAPEEPDAEEDTTAEKIDADETAKTDTPTPETDTNTTDDAPSDVT